MDTHVATIGVDFKIKTLNENGKVIKLQIWDTAGQERFRSLAKSYYSGSHGAAVVFDVTSRETFDRVDFWFGELQGAGAVPCKILIGNKCDLPGRAVGAAEADELARRLGVPYLETSAKEATNVDRMFEVMTQVMLESAQATLTATLGDGVSLDTKNAVKVGGGGCC
jgi:Ras-related protein Rab-1A